jgi:hypothetical protein
LETKKNRSKAERARDEAKAKSLKKLEYAALIKQSFAPTIDPLKREQVYFIIRDLVTKCFVGINQN